MQPPYRSILVALAATESDRALLDYAALLARVWPDARFQLVHVLADGAMPARLEMTSGREPGGREPGGPEPGGTDPGDTDPGGTEPGSTEPRAGRPEGTARTAEHRAVEGEHAALRDRLLADVPAGFASLVEEGRAACAIVHGPRLDALLRFAVDAGSDLILLGHRRHRSGRRSLARRLAMKAPCSIWLVPEGCPATLEHILAPVDFSVRAADALHVATTIAASAGLDEMHALHVRFNDAAVTFDEYAEIEMAEENEAFALFVAPIDLQGVHVKPIFEEGRGVSQTITRVAASMGTDLIVMGTRGRSAASSVLLGSETEQVMMESPVPVLAVKHYGASRRFIEVLLDARVRQRGDLRFT